MNMASRNIANMHLFLEMKKKFPYLPEDTLRGYVFLYAEDQDKCLSLLQKESDNLYHRSQQFSDFRLLENKVNFKLNESIKGNSDVSLDHGNINLPFQQNKTRLSDNSNMKNNNFQQNTVYHSSDKNDSHDGVVQLSNNKSTYLNTSINSKSHSAPILENSEKPFISMFKSVPESSHGSLNTSYDQNYYNRMMFSTTKEHIIQPPETSNDIKTCQILPNSNNIDTSQRHAVKLSITPVHPFHQQQMNVYSNALCASASHSSRPGRHTTSLNFQLQPHSSDQCPLEITTVPTNMEKPCNNRDFGSHVQISVGAQGTTFTALRLQRPTTSQNQNLDYTFNRLPTDETHFKYSQTSSQDKNSKTDRFPIPSQASSTSTKDNSRLFDHIQIQSDHDYNYSYNNYMQSELNESKEFSSPIKFGHGFQTSSDYIQAVKKKQCSQLNYIQEEINKGKAIYSKLKSEVDGMEKELARKNFSYDEVIKQLKEENRQLRLECNYLLMEYDMCSKGQIPVGVTDEDFYSNIFKGPNDDSSLYSYNDKNASKEESHVQQTQVTEDEFDEKNSWKCKKCTFVNHPALEKCEICEISKNSGYVEFNSNYSSSSHIQLVSPPEKQHKRAVGSVQISVTRRIPSYSKSVKFQVTHRRPR